MDLAVTIERMPEVSGPRCAVLGGGGGVSVLAADICDRNDIPVPWFGEATQKVLREFTPVAGTSIRNPLDAGFMFEGDHMETALKAVSDDPNIDWLMVHTGTDGGTRARDEDFAEETANSLATVAEKVVKTDGGRGATAAHERTALAAASTCSDGLTITALLAITASSPAREPFVAISTGKIDSLALWRS